MEKSTFDSLHGEYRGLEWIATGLDKFEFGQQMVQFDIPAANYQQKVYPAFTDKVTISRWAESIIKHYYDVTLHRLVLKLLESLGLQSAWLTSPRIPLMNYIQVLNDEQLFSVSEIADEVDRLFAEGRIQIDNPALQW